jgi:hypothetical protein
MASSVLLEISLPALEKDTGIKARAIAKGMQGAIREGMDENVNDVYLKIMLPTCSPARALVILPGTIPLII